MGRVHEIPWQLLITIRHLHNLCVDTCVNLCKVLYINGDLRNLRGEIYIVGHLQISCVETCRFMEAFTFIGHLQIVWSPAKFGEGMRN